MCFVWISEQTAIISLYSINWLVCINETKCVYCAVRTGYLTTIPVKPDLQNLKHVYEENCFRVKVVICESCRRRCVRRSSVAAAGLLYLQRVIGTSSDVTDHCWSDLPHSAIRPYIHTHTNSYTVGAVVSMCMVSCLTALHIGQLVCAWWVVLLQCTLVMCIVSCLTALHIGHVHGELSYCTAHWSCAWWVVLLHCTWVSLEDTCLNLAQLVEALRYKSEGRGFDSRWYHWNFSLT